MNIGIITGIGKGIGLDISKSFINDGKIVIGINKTNNKQIENLKKNKNFYFYKSDITNFKKIDSIINNIFKKYSSIDFLINNAGVRARIPLKKAKITDYQKVFNINTLGSINIAKSIIDKTYNNNKKIKKLKIINISSIVGIRGFKDLSVYSCSKAALDAFTKSICIEYAKKGLIINSIAPGFIETSYFKNFKKKQNLYDWTIENTPMQRWGKEKEITELIMFLINNNSDYINGTVIKIDGGWTAK